MGRIRVELSNELVSFGLTVHSPGGLLPEASALEGKRSGAEIQFTKQYQGDVYRSYVIGNRGVRHCDPGHSVEHRGLLSTDGTQIEGVWSIYEPELPNGSINGKFELVRVEDPD